MRKTLKKVDDIVWSDNLEISSETDECLHESIEAGRCTECGECNWEILGGDLYD